jgi:crossover junction endodeoxyribonuclease RusA
MTEPRTWTITISAPCAWLTANSRMHRMAEAKLIKQWRLASCLAARWAKLPTGLGRVRIDAVAHFRGRAPVRDTDNLRPTLKAVVDGLGPQRITKRGVVPGHGLIADDDDGHLDGPHLVIGDKLPALTYGRPGELVLTITEVTA